MNSVLGVALLSTSVGGLLVDWLGYRGLFCWQRAAMPWAVDGNRMREPRRMLTVQ